MKKKQSSFGVSGAIVGGVTAAIVVSQGLSIPSAIATAVMVGLIGGVAAILLGGGSR